MDKIFKHPSLHGVGIGLRSCHYPYIEAEYPKVPWFEVLSDNYLNNGGHSLFHLEKIRSSYPVSLHGVGMSLGSTDPLDQTYLQKLKSLIQSIDPIIVSDHLCWTSFSGNYFHELLPLPYTEEAVKHLANRIRQVQDFLGQRIMIENVSTYLNYTHSTLSEWEFLSAVATQADTLILLDINNIYVSAHNNQFNAEDYLKGVPAERVTQFHLAGFEDHGTHLLDTHGTPIQSCVWDLYKQALHHLGPVPTLIERDNNIPDFPELLGEANLAKKIMDAHVVTTRITETICL
jgi:uncharacterized protein (UPF0276 family)